MNINKVQDAEEVLRKGEDLNTYLSQANSAIQREKFFSEKKLQEIRDAEARHKLAEATLTQVQHDAYQAIHQADLVNQEQKTTMQSKMQQSEHETYQQTQMVKFLVQEADERKKELQQQVKLNEQLQAQVANLQKLNKGLQDELKRVKASLSEAQQLSATEALENEQELDELRH